MPGLFLFRPRASINQWRNLSKSMSLGDFQDSRLSYLENSFSRSNGPEKTPRLMGVKRISAKAGLNAEFSALCISAHLVTASVWEFHKSLEWSSNPRETTTRRFDARLTPLLNCSVRRRARFVNAVATFATSQISYIEYCGISVTGWEMRSVLCIYCSGFSPNGWACKFHACRPSSVKMRQVFSADLHVNVYGLLNGCAKTSPFHVVLSIFSKCIRPRVTCSTCGCFHL